MDFLFEPWPWYFSGPLIGVAAAALLYFSNKNLGLSSSFRHICAMGAGKNVPYLNYNWKEQSWNLVFVAGIAVGAWASTLIFGAAETSSLAESTRETLASYKLASPEGLAPREIFSWENLFSVSGVVFIILGGFLVGFGTRYAEGCTSGHAIMGLATLQWQSLLAVVFFFVGGLLATHFIIPTILG